MHIQTNTTPSRAKHYHFISHSFSAITSHAQATPHAPKPHALPSISSFQPQDIIIAPQSAIAHAFPPTCTLIIQSHHHTFIPLCAMSSHQKIHFLSHAFIIINHTLQPHASWQISHAHTCNSSFHMLS